MYVYVTVEQLIEMLKKCNQKSKVSIFEGSEFEYHLIKIRNSTTQGVILEVISDEGNEGN